jgi:replicative DNA helicase
MTGGDELEGKKKLDKVIAAAQEGDPEDRHRKEEAILATVAACKLDDPFLSEFAIAHVGRDLTFTRDDLDAVADGVAACVISRVAVHPDTVRARLKEGADVSDAVLRGVLDGSKAVDVTVAQEYFKALAFLDKVRGLEDIARELKAEAVRLRAKGGDPEVAFGEAVKKFLDIGRDRRLVEEAPFEDRAVLGFMEELRKRRDSGREYLGLDCGFRHLNEVLNGLTEGLFVLAGEPSCGKTTFMKQVADQVAEKERVSVLFFSYEQSADELRIKSLARLGMVDSRIILKGRTDPGTWAKVETAAKDYGKGPGPFLKVIEARREDTVEKIRLRALVEKYREECRRKEAGNVDADKPAVMVVIDYLQIVPATDPLTNRAFPSVRERVDFLLSELRRLARELKAPVLAVSSENREAYKDPQKPPTLVGLKESGGIEYSADVVICLWPNMKATEEELKRLEQETVRVELRVLKNRNGERAKVKTDFTPAWASFDNVEKAAEGLTREEALGKE